MTTRFVIELRDSAKPDFDPAEVELENEEAARIEAITALTALAKDALPDGNVHDFTTSVRDARGTTLFEATLSLRARWVDARR